MNGALRPSTDSQIQSETKIDLPPAVSEPVSLEQAPMPQVEPAPIPPAIGLPAQQDVRLEAPPVRRVVANREAAAHRSRPETKKPAASKKKSATDSNVLKYASPWKSTGVSGRMVRVGAYSSMDKGKDAWSRLAILSPAIKQLPAVVTDIPSPTGRTLYWLQIGTTSQAHSEVLCQRMRAIGQRCVVVDLAGARKDSGNGRQPVGI
jgi:hypothetical protein